MYYLLNKFKDIIKIKKILKDEKIEKIFNKIYISNYWSDKETRSGPGSNKDNTRNIIKYFPYIIKKFKIKSIVDAPCGEFYWIEKIINNYNLKYTGLDIVNKIIKFNKKKSTKKISFQKINIIKEKIPKADLLICRDCWTHFSYLDTINCIKNFKKTSIKYILITGFDNKIINKDINTGDFRMINLFKNPYNFSKNYLLKIKDGKAQKNIRKYLYLYNKNQFFKNIKI